MPFESKANVGPPWRIRRFISHGACFGVWSRMTEDMPLHGGTAFSKTWPNRNPNESVAWMGKIRPLFSETVANSVFFIWKRWIQIFWNQGARRSMADAKAQKEDMESKLAELQSINKDEFRTRGFAIGILCATLEGEARGWLGTRKPRKILICPGPGWSTLQATSVRPTARPQSKGSRIQ